MNIGSFLQNLGSSVCNWLLYHQNLAWDKCFSTQFPFLSGGGRGRVAYQRSCRESPDPGRPLRVLFDTPNRYLLLHFKKIFFSEMPPNGFGNPSFFRKIDFCCIFKLKLFKILVILMKFWKHFLSSSKWKVFISNSTKNENFP